MTTLGPYELLQRLGAGGTAEVFLAAGPNPRGHELLALKVMLESHADSRSSREAFLKEARTSALLRHKHLVEIFEVGEAQGRPYIAMELVRGWSIAALHKKMREAKEQFGVDEACEVIRQAALGLHYIHEVHGSNGAVLGLIHRDVSPQNVILDEEGVVKVVDFGLAKATAAGATQTTGLKGKLRYMPPEQLKGEGLDRRLDVFALGAVLWELVCDGPLHPGPSEAEIFQQAFFNPQPHPDEVKKGLPRTLVEVLQRAVERDRSRRTPTAAALAEALAPLCGVDVGARLAERVARHFPRLPLTRAQVESPGGPVKSGAPRTAPPLPAPPGELPRGPGFGGAQERTDPVAIPLGAQESPTDPHPLAITASRLDPVRTEAVRTEAVRTEAVRTEAVRTEAVRTEAVRTDAAPRPAARGPRVPASPPRRAAPTRAAATRAPVMLGRREVAAVGALLSLALVFVGFVAARRLFPQEPEVVEVAQPVPPRWRDPPPDLVPGDPPAPPPPSQAGDSQPDARSPAEVRTTPAGKTGSKRAPTRGTSTRRGTGKLFIDASEPAHVLIGNRTVGMTGRTLAVKAGRHAVEVTTPDGSRSATLDVEVVAGQETRRRVQLRPAR